VAASASSSNSSPALSQGLPSSPSLHNFAGLWFLPLASGALSLWLRTVLLLLLLLFHHLQYYCRSLLLVSLLVLGLYALLRCAGLWYLMLVSAGKPWIPEVGFLMFLNSLITDIFMLLFFLYRVT
jgi:hypothetical protein